MTFKEWIRKRRVVMPLHVGDFILDVQRDIRAGDFPDIATLEKLLLYLQRSHACEPAMRAAPIVWRKYEKACAPKFNVSAC
jgi:hypothetical protein